MAHETEQAGLDFAESAEVAVVQQQTPLGILADAVTRGLDPDTIRQLMDLADRDRKQRAEQAYNDAIVRFQMQPPKIVRSKQGHTGKYAPINEVLNAVLPVLSALDFSVRWQFKVLDNGDNVCRCYLTHRDGHSQHSDFFAVKDTSGAKSGPQAIQSGRTYAKRYTLFDVLGLEQDVDNDGANVASVSHAQLGTLCDLRDNLPDGKAEAFDKWLLTTGVADLDTLPAARFDEVAKFLKRAGGSK